MYKVVEIQRKSKGGPAEGCIGQGQYEQGDRAVVGTHLPKGSHKGIN
jgi:hypothetical protein